MAVGVRSDVMRLFLVIILLAVASRASAQTPTERAKAIIETQRATLDKDLAGMKSFLGQLDPAGIVVGNMSVETPKTMLELLNSKEVSRGGEYWAENALQSLFWAGRDMAVKTVKQTVKTTVANLVAGGRADAVWFTFDLTVDRATTIGGKPFRKTDTFRITELAVDNKGWKVTLFHIDTARPDKWDDLPSHDGGPPEGEEFTESGDTNATALVEVASSPTKLAKALLVEPSTVVLGSSAGDRGVGPAAAKLVASWSKLKLAAESSLSHTSKTWGFAVVRLDLDGKNEDQKMRMFATVIGLPKADGTWQIVTLHYSRIMSM